MTKSSKILAICLLCVVCFCLGWCSRPTPQPKTEIKTIYDTIERIKVEPCTIYQTKTVVRNLVRYDTITQTDSVLVYVPISDYHFKEDSLFDIVASGYEVELKSVKVYPKTIIQTTTIQAPRKPFRFSVGAQVGYGITPKGAQPYVGVGVGFGYTF